MGLRYDLSRKCNIRDLQIFRIPRYVHSYLSFKFCKSRYSVTIISEKYQPKMFPENSLQFMLLFGNIFKTVFKFSFSLIGLVLIIT